METHAALSLKLARRRGGSVFRLPAAVVCGVIAGMTVTISLQFGFRFLLGEELGWGRYFWGEHWILRIATSCISAMGLGFIAGAIVRHRGAAVGAVAAIPAALVWLWVAVSVLSGQLLFLGEVIHVSNGNTIAAIAIALLAIPAAYYGGLAGESFGDFHGDHFDSRPATLLGIKWYHYLWLPFLIHLILMQIGWSGLYGFEWLKLTFSNGPDFRTLLPGVIVIVLLFTYVLLGLGLCAAYRILSGLEPVASARTRAALVSMFGIGVPMVVWVLQKGIMALHHGVANLLD